MPENDLATKCQLRAIPIGFPRFEQTDAGTLHRRVVVPVFRLSSVMALSDAGGIYYIPLASSNEGSPYDPTHHDCESEERAGFPVGE